MARQVDIKKRFLLVHFDRLYFPIIHVIEGNELTTPTCSLAYDANIPLFVHVIQDNVAGIWGTPGLDCDDGIQYVNGGEGDVGVGVGVHTYFSCKGGLGDVHTTGLQVLGRQPIKVSFPQIGHFPMASPCVCGKGERQESNLQAASRPHHVIRLWSTAW